MADVSQEEINMFKNLTSLVSDESEYQPIASNYNTFSEYDNSFDIPYVDDHPEYQNNTAPLFSVSDKVQIKTAPYQDIKSITVYSLQLGSTTLISRLYSKDAAEYLAKELNSGKSFDDPLMLGILSLGLKYTKSIDTLSLIMSERQKALRKKDYDAAKVYDGKINVAHSDAISVIELITSKIALNK